MGKAALLRELATTYQHLVGERKNVVIAMAAQGRVATVADPRRRMGVSNATVQQYRARLGRPRLGERAAPSVKVDLRLGDELAHQVEAAATARGVTRSSYMREAIARRVVEDSRLLAH
ncbi:MAG: ribbon-helix-helix domain-containing protein [Bifidobacteriaceae bacterium]|jgi:hypothetical protein|nr:ribbon-helix-helix domain-containing protein [Bifidobacteriaceae bacterium]